ncbi:MAG: hypothetical protein ACFFC7_00205 [Candidatus Hermodarchaeota archaeon]
MSHAITNGLLSNLDPQNTFSTPLSWLEFGKTLIEIVPQFKVAEVHPEREEILLKANISDSCHSEAIRIILQELHNQTQRSFIALANPTSQYVLITVRG